MCRDKARGPLPPTQFCPHDWSYPRWNMHKETVSGSQDFFLACGRTLSGVISRLLHGQLVTYPTQKKFRLRRPGWGWPLLTKNSCYRGRMNCLIWHKKHDIVTQRVHTKIHFTKLLFTGEEFMVLENIIGEKFMIPWKNIHPWLNFLLISDCSYHHSLLAIPVRGYAAPEKCYSWHLEATPCRVSAYRASLFNPSDWKPKYWI